MTKSKKMKKSTFAIVIMAILMVAMLAFGGTYAYFTATADGASKSATVGKVILEADGTKFTAASDKVVPGDTVFAGQVSFDNQSDVNTIVVANRAFLYTGKVWSSSPTLNGSEDFAAYTARTGNEEDGYTYPAGTALEVAADETEGDNGYFYEVTDMPITGSELTGGAVAGSWLSVGDGVHYIYGTSTTAGEPATTTYSYLVADTVDTADLFADESGTADNTEDNGAKVVLNASRHYLNGIYDGTDSGELVWEGATIEVEISFQQIQYDNLSGVTYESGVIKSDTTPANLYAAIKALLK